MHFRKLISLSSVSLNQCFIVAKILWEYSGVSIFTYVSVFHLFQCDVGQYLGIQFYMVDHETGTRT
jgi:hypothetical protein